MMYLSILYTINLLVFIAFINVICISICDTKGEYRDADIFLDSNTI